MEGNGVILELLLPKPGGMCYRHILTRPGGGSRLRWASEDNYNVFINQPCAGVLGQVVRVSFMVVLIQFRFNKIESNPGTIVVG